MTNLAAMVVWEMYHVDDHRNPKRFDNRDLYRLLIVNGDMSSSSSKDGAPNLKLTSNFTGLVVMLSVLLGYI